MFCDPDAARRPPPMTVPAPQIRKHIKALISTPFLPQSRYNSPPTPFQTLSQVQTLAPQIHSIPCSPKLLLSSSSSAPSQPMPSSIPSPAFLPPRQKVCFSDSSIIDSASHRSSSPPPQAASSQFPQAAPPRRCRTSLTISLVWRATAIEDAVFPPEAKANKHPCPIPVPGLRPLSFQVCLLSPLLTTMFL